MTWQWVVITLILVAASLIISWIGAWKEVRMRQAETLLTMNLEEIRRKENAGG